MMKNAQNEDEEKTLLLENTLLSLRFGKLLKTKFSNCSPGKDFP